MSSLQSAVNYRFGNKSYSKQMLQSKPLVSTKKIKWQSKKIIKEKIIDYKMLPGWKPKNSSIDDLINYIDS